MKSIEWEQSLLEPRPCPDLEQRFTRETGRAPGMIRFMKGSGWLSDAVIRLSVELENRVSLERGIADEAGLQRGRGVAGLVGSHHLKEFTFVGGAVNVAARVQDMTRVHPADILLTHEMSEWLDPRFQLRTIPATLVKGIEEPLVLYAMDAFEQDSPVHAHDPVGGTGDVPVAAGASAHGSRVG